MEGYFHSHTRSHSRGPSTFSGNKNKKPPLFPTNDGGGGGFSATSYDDVFGGAPRYAALAPRAEDYSEIFGAFRSSSSRAYSIPVLDLPAAADMESSVFDYSEVFGGFHAVDLAVSFDELFRPFDVGDGCSSDDAWTPVGTESLSDDSDPFAFSEKSQCFSNENSLQPLDSKQFTVSYHKVNPGTSTCLPNVIHVAQLNAVPGYTCVVDETTSSREMEKETLCSAMDNDTIFSVDSSSIMPQKHLLPQSRPFPVEAEKKVDISILNSGLKASDNCALESTVDSWLPPCFDMELDSSSSAAASAAAMRDAMEKAQSKLKAAKVLMDRKKDALQDTAKLNLKTDVHWGENINMVHDECASGDIKVHTASDKGPAKMENSGKVRRATTASQILPDSLAVEQPDVVVRKPAERKHGKKCSLSMDTAFTEGNREWKEATEFYEFVTDNPKSAPEPPSKSDSKTVAFKQQGNDDDSDSTGKACVPEGNRRRLKPTKAVSRQEYYDKMVKVAQEVHDRVIGGHAETDQTLTGIPQGNHREQKAKLAYEPEMNAGKIGQGKPAEEEKPGETTWKEEAKKESNTAFEKEEIKKKETKKKGTEACQREQDVRKTYGPHQSQSSDKDFPSRKEEEKRKKESYDRVASERRVEVVVNEENEKRAKEAYESQRKENKLADAVKQKKDKRRREVKDKRAKEPFEDGFDGEGVQTTCESQENGKTKDLKRKVEDKRSKEDLADVFGGERFQRTCQKQENDKRKNLMQRDEDLNHAEVAVDGRGSERILEESFELDECWKYKKAPGQVVRRKRQDECHKLAAGDQISEECLKQGDNEEELEKITEQETDENKPMQAAEMDEAVKIPEKTDVEDQNGVSKNRLKIELEDENTGSYGAPEIDLPIENEHLNSSDGANAHEKNVEADVFQDVSARIRAIASDESKLKAVETTHVFDAEKPTESIAAQMGADDSEHERTVRASDSLDRNDSNGNSGQVCTRTGQKLKDDNKKLAQSVPDHRLVKDSNLVKSTPAEGINGWNEHARKKEAVRTVMQERKESIQRSSQLPNSSHSAERKGKFINQNRYSEEKTKEKERDPEKEQFRKLEEEREREREREKDRMAVEITIHEARERAYADVRERATDEARQRAMAEARERLEKACTEARERSLADKASDARLRAERAAVERATAEARQRAFEKAMAERVTFEARERMQRSVSEKYTSERDVVMRQSSMPSTHSDKFEAADGEPAQRCKARLERHRRTVERVAKALAEKNMRDLIAQREQAERTRLAENLDADIKRWSSGKEGNLRALLSTLQYILGPDSGWQPIPLTEVITAAAVKKAYRKATLCVHPDKLQQRGASIQHKYVCEKVFDLLKEAWNRFNSEEK